MGNRPANRDRPASWSIDDQLVPRGVGGIVLPIFAPGADADDRNLALWDWGPALPRKVEFFDPSCRLPRDQLYLVPRKPMSSGCAITPTNGRVAIAPSSNIVPLLPCPFKTAVLCPD